LVISPSKPTAAVHKTLQFTAMGIYSDGSTKDLTTSVTWSSSDTTTVTISDPSAFGVATAVAVGTTEIGASLPGGVSASPVQMSVTATIYAYATNIGSDTVSQYVVGQDGSLTPLGTPEVPAGHQPFSIAVEPTGDYVYVANWGSSTVSQYRIGTDG